MRLERAQRQGYIKVDQRDDFDAVADAYQQWYREQGRAFIKIALGDATSSVILSVIEADQQFPIAVETALREKIPSVSQLDADIAIEDDYYIALRVLNELMV